EEGTRLGQFCALPRLDLRLRPVDAEDLGPARFELAEIAVERRICRTLAIVVGRQVFADRLVPGRRPLGWENAAHDRSAPTSDLLLEGIRHSAGTNRSKVDSGDDGAAAFARL